MNAAAAFEATCQIFKDAERALARSRTMKNKIAYVAARDDCEVAGNAARAEQEAMQRAYRVEQVVAWRAAKAAAKAAAASTQPDLFA